MFKKKCVHLQPVSEGRAPERVSETGREGKFIEILREITR